VRNSNMQCLPLDRCDGGNQHNPSMYPAAPRPNDPFPILGQARLCQFPEESDKFGYYSSGRFRPQDDACATPELTHETTSRAGTGVVFDRGHDLFISPRRPSTDFQPKTSHPNFKTVSHKSAASSSPIVGTSCDSRVPVLKQVTSPKLKVSQTTTGINTEHKTRMEQPNEPGGIVPKGVPSISAGPVVSQQQPVKPMPTHPPGPGPGEYVSRHAPQKPNRNVSSYTGERRPSFEREWAKVRRLRPEVWSLRSRIQEMRRVLRDRQLALAIANDSYFKYVEERGHGINFGLPKASPEQNTFQALIDACQLARNNYGPLEDDCILLENRLSAKEFELHNLETVLYEWNLDEQQFFQLGDAKSPCPSPISSSHSGSEGGQLEHPLVSEYLSKVGDVEILRERLDWHVDEKYTLEEERERRDRVGMALAEDDQKWLDNYSVAENALIEEFEQAEKEAVQLKQKCLALGLVDDDGEPTNLEHREQRVFAEDFDADVGSVASEYVRFPRLIPQPNAKRNSRNRFPPSVMDTLDNSHSSALRVDWWILDQLQMSPLEVGLLARTFESGYGPISDDGTWQEDVLAYWYKDGARETRLGPRTSTGMVTMAPREPGHSSNTSLEDTELDFLRLATRNPLQQSTFSVTGFDMSPDDENMLSAPRPTRLAQSI